MAYTLTGRKCGTLRFNARNNGVVEKESLSRSSKVTSNPIEGGSNIDDHIFRNPEQFQISGVVIGGEDARLMLERMWEERDLITYIGRTRIDNLAITSLKFDKGADNKLGFSFNISMQRCQIGVAEEVQGGKIRMMSDMDFGSGGSSAAATGGGRTKSDGRHTTSSTNITSNAYYDYVSGYNGSGTSPSVSGSPAYSGR